MLTAERRGVNIELDFPATPATQSEAADGILEALGVSATTPTFVGETQFDKFLVL